MKIKWLGHSCFLITNDAGGRLLTDPVPPEMGYQPPREQVDIVTISHGHFDHCYTAELQEEYKLWDAIDVHEERGFRVYGVVSDHDKAGGAQRGKNIIYVIEADGIKVVHLGDLGDLPTAEQVEAIGAVDVLMVPVGGFYTIDNQDAHETMRKFKPKLTIPMHYRNEHWNDEKILGLAPFTDLCGNVKEAFSDEIDVSRHLAGEPTVLVMKVAE